MTAWTTSESIGDFLRTDDVRSRRKSFPWIMVCVSLVVLASIGYSLNYTAREDAQVSREYTLKLAIYREQADRIARLEQITAQEGDVAAQAGFDASLVDALPRSRSLAEITSALNAGIRLTDISLSNADRSSGASAIQAGDAPTTIEPPANQLQIKGVALSGAQLSQFVARLSRSGWFRAIQWVPTGPKNVRAIGPRQFVIAATFERNASTPQSALCSR